MDARPVFIRVDDTRDVNLILSLAKNKLREARALMDSIQDLSRHEAAELSAWQRELNVVKNRTENIDKTLVELE